MAPRLLPLFFIAILLFSCQSSSTEPASSQVVIRIASEPKSLHPVNGQSGLRVEILSITCQHLVRLDPVTQEPTPLLAKALPTVSEDGLVYTYELDSLAAWDDGHPILATDVDFSLKAAANPINTIQAGKTVYEHIERLELHPENERKLSLIMKERYVGNPYVVHSFYIIDKRFFDPEGVLDSITIEKLLDPNGPVVQDSNVIKWSAEFNDAKYNRDPAYMKGTSGPYEVTDWIPNQQIILSRRENYWGKNRPEHYHSQHPDKIIFKAITDENSLALQIKQGEIDVATLLPSSVYRQLVENEEVPKSYHLGYRHRYSYTYVGLNLRPDGIAHRPIFSDKKVRRALSYVMPVDEIIRDFYHGDAKRVVSPVAMSSPDYNQHIQPLPFLPDSAISLLEAAGWKDSDGDLVRDKRISGELVPLSFKLSYPAGVQSLVDMVERITDAAMKVGMEIEPDPVNMMVLQTKLLNRDYDALMVGSSTTILPYDFKQLWATESIAAGTNFFGFSNHEVDSLIEVSNRALHPKRRKVLVDRIQEILYEEQPVIFFFNPPNYMIAHKRFDHAEMHVMRPHILCNYLKLKN